MAVKLVAESATIDIGKLLHLKVKSFVATGDGPGEFSMVGKKLFFETPAMELGDDYETSVTITYLNKKGKEFTKDFDFVVGDTDGTKSYMLGDDGPNSLIYNANKNLLMYGLDGDDILKPGNKDDKLYGGGGNDEIYGYGGNDKISGGDGNDTINGGEGTNIMNGGAGDDLIFIRGTNDTATGGDGIDSFGVYNLDGAYVITDFVSGVDKLYYEEARFNESQFSAIATKTDKGTLLTFDSTTTVLLEGFSL